MFVTVFTKCRAREALRGLRRTRGESHQRPLEEDQDQAASCSLSKMRRYFYDEGVRLPRLTQHLAVIVGLIQDYNNCTQHSLAVNEATHTH